MKRFVSLLIVTAMFVTSMSNAFAASDYAVATDNTVYSRGAYMFVTVTVHSNALYTVEILKGDSILMSFSASGGLTDFPILIPADWQGGTDYSFRAGRGTDIASVSFAITEISTPKVTPIIASLSSSTVAAGTKVTLSNGTPEAVIYYTLNGSTPSSASTPYTSAGITISVTTTLKAIAVREGYEDSDVLTRTYTVETDNGGGNSGGGGGNGGGGNSGGGGGGVGGIVPPTAPRYSDVSTQNWFYDAVEFVSEKGLMSGTGLNEFSPTITTNRAMMVTMLYRLENQPAVTGSSPFSDVETGQWYTDAVIWAAENGVVSGYANGTYGWNDPVTREQAVTILYRYAKSKNLNVSAQGDLSVYTDIDDISDWAHDAMEWATSAEIIQGRTATTIVPQGVSSRAEIATIFKRYIEGFSG